VIILEKMSLQEVTQQLKMLHQSGDTLNKKKIKKTNPDLMRHALYYYPSWEHALQESGIM
jgi:hypothetical protein